MSRGAKIALGVIITIAVVAGLVLIYIYASGGSGEASETISAPTLAPAQQPTEAVQPTSEETAAVSAQEAASEASSSSGLVTFNIVPDESLVSFELDEVLRGVPTTVVGITNQVAGQLRVDPQNPQEAEVGTIRINVRTLATDNEFRNRAIRGQILLSAQDEYEFAEFVPTAITGLPNTVAINEAFNFQITGDLTLRGITNSVTFDVTVTPVSASRLEGTATATVNRADYQLQIPNVPGVANVEEEVLLTINFVAVA